MIIGTGNINSLLASSFQKDASLGLAHGKMGGCLYFYYLSRAQNSPDYRITAEKLLADIFGNIRTVEGLDMKNGLGGIGLGIHYLIKNKYVQGDVNKILRDIDDTVFKDFTDTRTSFRTNIAACIHILLYLSVRLPALDEDSEQGFLLRELAIQTINVSCNRIGLELFDEPAAFRSDYMLPLYIYVLGKMAGIGFYNHRIARILGEISSEILSRVPRLHANRLYLMAALNYAARHLTLDGWAQHILLLKQQIDFDVILDREIQSWNIFIDGGFAGVRLLADSSPELFSCSELSGIKQKIDRKTRSSQSVKQAWDLDTITPYKGLLNGFPGVALTRDNLLQI